VNRTYPKILRNRKQRIARRLDPKRRWSEQREPMMSASNIHFEMAERSQALNYGGIGAIHLMGQRLGLAQEIDGRLQLLKRHLPYHESDHVLTWLTMPCSMASVWKISSYAVMMKLSWMVWERNVFLILRPVEILHDALMKTLF
jgi:hypothetical protein